MDNRVRFAIVGGGGIAQGYSQALEDCRTARLVAVADVRPEAARALAERSRCSSYPSHQALMEGDTPFDAVLICTPPSSHEDLATYFLQRKISVLCEKPFTLTSSGARQLTQLARNNSVQLTMAAKFRFVDDVIRAKSIVASGILGEIILFENAFTSRIDMSKRWNSDPKISGGGVLVDNGPHSVDLMRYFLGPLADVQVVAGKRVQGVPVEDTALVFVRSKSGVMGRIDLSWSINKELDSYIKIYGSHGTISVGWKESKYRQLSSPDWVVFGKGYDKTKALRSQLENFVAAMHGEEKLLITPEDAIASVEVIEAANRAIRDEHWISVGPSAESPIAAIVPALAEVPVGWRSPRIHPTAIIESGVEIGPGTSVWDNVHVRHSTRIGEECLIGEKTYVAYDVRIGNRVKLNAFVYVCTAVTIEDGVMISAGTIFTNDRFPRACTSDLKSLRPSEPDETTRPTLVKAGATIGAGSIIGCDLSIGRFAMVGMGSVVTRSVPDFHLVIGNPARSVGCVCRCGHLLLHFEAADSRSVVEVKCQACRLPYAVEGRVVRELAPPT